MESSRGGPLSTFIMTLPLIVVPAIAMLKPADNGRGLVSSLLSAASGRDDSDESADSPDSDAPGFGEDEFDALFGNSGSEQSETPPDTASPFHEDTGESLVEDFSNDFQTSPQSHAHANAPPPAVMLSHDPADLSQNAGNVSAELMSRLQKMGATKTLWFSPGQQTVGFVAFFSAGPGVVSYRFESIARTRTAAVQDVIRQAQEWQQSTRP